MATGQKLLSLAKGLEDDRQRFWRDAGARVCHSDFYPWAAGADLDGHAPLFGKLDRVFNQVLQHDLELCRVCVQRWQSWRHPPSKRQARPLLQVPGLALQLLNQLGNNNFFEIQRQPPCFKTAHIERGINQFAQRSCASLHSLQDVGLLCG